MKSEFQLKEPSFRSFRFPNNVPHEIIQMIFQGKEEIFVDLEYSIHAVSRFFLNELKSIFPELDSDSEYKPSALHIVPTFQQCLLDIVGIGKDIEDEKNTCLERVRTQSFSII
jgi:hypothetical protein